MLFLRKKTESMPIGKQSLSGRPIQSVSPSIMLLMNIAPMDLERPSSLNCATINGYFCDRLWIPRRSRLPQKPAPGEDNRDQLAKLAKKHLQKNTYKAAV